MANTDTTTTWIRELSTPEQQGRYRAFCKAQDRDAAMFPIIRSSISAMAAEIKAKQEAQRGGW